jgi:hypothetical protein
LIRDQRVAQEAKLKKQLGSAFIAFEQETLTRTCLACSRRDGLTSAADAFVLPPINCVVGCTANYGLGPKIDFIADVD